jgi:hypothetical protein
VRVVRTLGIDTRMSVLDEVLELRPEVLQESLYRPRCRFAERADRVALDVP